ncbi:hypothetical protein M408DRAFT_328690, partial [Serendipita vermifera MAFF 305830]
MTVTISDSVPLYSEGTFDEHIQELATYLARGRSDEDRTTFIRPFVDALLPKEGRAAFDESQEARREVLQLVLERTTGIGEGSEREVEGFFNLLVAYVLHDFPDPTAPIEALINAIVSAKKAPVIKYRLLSNIFNATPRSSPLRLKTYTALLKLASTHDEMDVLHLHKAEVDKWLDEWDIDVEDRAAFCKSIADALVKAGQPSKAYPYLILRAQILPTTSPNAEKALIEVIVDGLRLTSIFNFEPILALPNITFVQEHCLFKLLKIFMGRGLSQYQAWLAEHEGELSSYDLDKVALDKKMRLITLTALASKNVGKEVPYAEIAQAIQVPENEVESWVIQTIRAKLILGKLNQPTRTFVVIKSTTRHFTPDDWETLDRRLTAWKDAVLEVLQVVTAARKKVPSSGGGGGGGGHAAAT